MQVQSETSFSDANVLAWLESADDAALDRAPFGVIAMDQRAVVVAYNRAESDLSGLTQARVLGRDFFNDVAPCTNNFMVAQRFEDEAELDETIPYVFTLRMHPRRVRLRLLKALVAARQYLLVETVS